MQPSQETCMASFHNVLQITTTGVGAVQRYWKICPNKASFGQENLYPHDLGEQKRKIEFL